MSTRFCSSGGGLAAKNARFHCMAALLIGSVAASALAIEPPPGQVVSTYGRLQVSGAALRDQSGNQIQLRGMSSHGITWFPLSDLNLNDPSNINLLNQEIAFDPTQGNPFPYPASIIGNLVDQWHVQVIKIAMFPYDPWNGLDAKCYTNDYPTWKWYNINLVNSIVQAAIDENIYVMVNWHAGEGNDPDPNVYWNSGHVQEFFTYMVDKWGSYPNIIYETVNSPNNISWSGSPGLKTYNQNVINLIRAREAANGYANNVIIAGTPTWSQDVDVAAADPLTGDRIAYAFMWYAGTHGVSIRTKADTALSTLAANNPNQTLFIIEGGTTQSDGSGGVFVDEFNTWMEWAKTKKLSWVNWSISSKEEDSAIFVPEILNDVPANEVAWRGGDGGSIPEALASTGYPMRTGPWTEDDYTVSGKLVRGWIIENTSQNPTVEPGTAIFEDGFEDDHFVSWSDYGWPWWARNQDAGFAHSGSYYSAANAWQAHLTSNNVNTVGYDELSIEFWYIDDDLSAGEMTLQFYNGSGYVDVLDLNLTTEDTWTKGTVTINNAGAEADYFRSDFHMRFHNAMGDPEPWNKNFYLDDVQIIVVQ